MPHGMLFGFLKKRLLLHCSNFVPVLARQHPRFFRMCLLSKRRRFISRARAVLFESGSSSACFLEADQGLEENNYSIPLHATSSEYATCLSQVWTKCL